MENLTKKKGELKEFNRMFGAAVRVSKLGLRTWGRVTFCNCHYGAFSRILEMAK